MELVASLEALERDAWESVCRAAPQNIVQELGIEIHRTGGVLTTVCARIDQGQFNRTFGFGLEGGDEARPIRDAAARFRALKIKNAFIQIPSSNPQLEEEAQRLDLVRYKRSWVKFRYAGQRAPDQATNVDVKDVERGQAELFGTIIAEGFGMPPIMVGWLGALVGRDGWHCYLAWGSGKAIGGAALYVNATGAWLGAGATLPDARKRGAQSALLVRRVIDARKLGAKVITTETGKPLEGEYHPSYDNIVRSGFEPAYERANWTLPS